MSGVSDERRGVAGPSQIVAHFLEPEIPWHLVLDGASAGPAECADLFPRAGVLGDFLQTYKILQHQLSRSGMYWSCERFRTITFSLAYCCSSLFDIYQ